MRSNIIDMILMDRMNRRNDYGRNDYARRDYGRRDYGKPYDEYEDDYEMDGRRGVKGTGRGRRYSDRGESLYLSKSDMNKWNRELDNADGTHGPHFSIEQIMKAAKDMNIHFDDFDERDLRMAANMLYSDFCEATRPYISPDRDCHFYVGLAKAFLEDDDGPEACEKLALYYYCIVENE